jgi:ribosomal protein S24E
MELRKVSEKDNPLFCRKEVVFCAASSPTPSRAKVAEAVSVACKCAKDCVVVDKVEQKFGTKTVEVRAKVYKSADDARRVESKYKFARLERSGRKKEAAKAPAAEAAKTPAA